MQDFGDPWAPRTADQPKAAESGQQYLLQKAIVRDKFYSAAKLLGHGLADGMQSINVNDYYCYQYYILMVKAESKHSILSCRLLVIQKVTEPCFAPGR